MFSDICTVSDEAFGRLTIERCWDSWLSECQNSNKEQKSKKQSNYTLNKTNQRFGGWSSEGMKRYDEIAKLVKSDRELNQQAELFFKDLMMEKNYGDKVNTPQITPVQVLSDIHQSLGDKYVPYNEFMFENTNDLKTNNEKQVISPTKAGSDNMITPDKHMSADSISSKPEIINVYQTQGKSLAELEEEEHKKLSNTDTSKTTSDTDNEYEVSKNVENIL